MECKKFHHWLRTRNDHNKQDSPGAMAHQANCSDCHKLYTLDTRAEQGVALAFASQDLPWDLAEKINQRLDLESPPSIFNWFISKQSPSSLLHLLVNQASTIFYKRRQGQCREEF